MENRILTLLRRPNYFEFFTDRGGVFVQCADTRCLTVENAPRGTFDAISRALNFPAAPAEVRKSETERQVTDLRYPESEQAAREAVR